MAQSEVLTTWQFTVTPLLRDLRGGGWQSLRSGWREVLTRPEVAFLLRRPHIRRGRSPGRGRPPCRDWGGPVGPLRGTAEPGRVMLHQGWCRRWGPRGLGGGPDDSTVTRLLPSGRGWGAGSPQLHWAGVGWGAVSTKERLGGAGRPSAGEHVGDSRVKGAKPGGRGWSSCGCPVGWTGICSGPPGGLASAVTARL